MAIRPYYRTIPKIWTDPKSEGWTSLCLAAAWPLSDSDIFEIIKLLPRRFGGMIFTDPNLEN